VQQGYNPNEINEIISLASGNPTLNHSPKEGKPTNYLPIILIIILIVAAIGGGIFFLMTKNKDTSSLNESVKGNNDGSKSTNVNTQIKATQSSELKLELNCDSFPDKLLTCTKYKCQFLHPFTGENMTKEILGIINRECNYVEQMPNNGKMECNYTESVRKAVAQYYKDAAKAESVGTSVQADLGSGDTQTTYTIDGKQVENPLQEAMTNGQCVISGYE
jgi:hypothetical protein